MLNRNGCLIEFSGVDGSGKSKQTELLYKALIKQGFKCTTNDIYKRMFFELTCNVFKKADMRNVYSVETAETLMICDEIIQYENNVKKIIRNENIAISARSISDRYLKAILYNAANKNDIQKICTLTIKPELHFYLQVSLENIMKRIENRGTDSENPDIIRKYIEIADTEAVRQGWIVINSNRDADNVHEEIYSIVIQYLSRRANNEP